MMTSMPCQQDTTSHQDALHDLEMLINKVPIVYTTKLDDMWIFQRNIKNISKGDLVDIILCESLPVFNSLPNVTPEDKDINNFNDLKSKLSKLFQKNVKKVPLKSKNSKLQGRRQSGSNSKEKSSETNPDSESQLDPSIESESSENITVIIIDCYGEQTVSTLRDLGYALKDIAIVIYDRTFNEHDVYVLDTDGCISDHHSLTENDVKLNRNDYYKKKVFMDFCCWVQRNKCVTSMYPQYVSLPTLKFMLKPHNCLPNRCLCCCREGDVDEIRTSDAASVISESKYVIPQDVDNYFLHKDWLAELKSEEKSSSKLIDRALGYNGKLTIKTNIESQTIKRYYSERHNKKVRFMKHEKEHKIIYEFNSNDGSLASQTRILPMHPRPLYLKRIKQYRRYSGCCWYDYNRLAKDLLSEKLNKVAKYYRRPHLCPIDYCACCCKNISKSKKRKITHSVTKKKGDDTNLKPHKMPKENTKLKASQKMKRSSQTTKKESLGKSVSATASSTHYEKTDSDMSVILFTKRSKHVWEKFENLRIIVTDDGKVSARVPRFYSLVAEEVKVLSKILASAEEEVQRQSLQPGTCFDVRMTNQNDNYLGIALELANDNDGMKKHCDDIQEQGQKNEHLDKEEQFIVPKFVDFAKEDKNYTEHQIENLRKTSYCDTGFEQQYLEPKMEINNVQDQDLSQNVEFEPIARDNNCNENQITTNDDFSIAHLHVSNLKNEPMDIQEHAEDNLQHQATEPENDILTDIMQPQVAFECEIEETNDIQNIIINIQEPENDLLVSEDNAAEPTILNFKLHEAERTSNRLPMDTNNITYVIQQPSTKSVLIPLKNIVHKENQDCQIVLPRIETTYSLQSVDDAPLNSNSNNYTNWNVSTCELSQIVKSAPKRKSDVQQNVPSKIRVVSPSKLGIDFGTNEKKSNESRVYRRYCKPNTLTIDKIHNAIKVTSEPIKTRKNIGEAPKYVKILPKPSKLACKKSGSDPSTFSPKPQNFAKANNGSAEPPPSSSQVFKMPRFKKRFKVVVLNPNDCLVTASQLPTANTNDIIIETENSNGIELEELTNMQICDIATSQSAFQNNIGDEVTTSELGTVYSCDVPQQLSTVNMNSDMSNKVTAPYDVAQLSTVNSNNESVNTANSILPNKEMFMTMNKTTLKRPKKPIILKSRNRNFVEYQQKTKN